jgi:hypothetical protein
MTMAIVVIRQQTGIESAAYTARKIYPDILTTGGWVTEFSGVGDVFVFPNEDRFRKAYPNAPRPAGTWWTLEWQTQN